MSLSVVPQNTAVRKLPRGKDSSQSYLPRHSHTKRSVPSQWEFSSAPLTGCATPRPAAGRLCWATAPRRQTLSALYWERRGSSGRCAGWRGRQQPPRGLAGPRPGPRPLPCAGRRLHASTWRRRPRARRSPARTVRTPGRGLRSPRRAAPGTEPPLLRELLAELRPRPLSWGAVGSSRPAGGVRRIPGGGGGERRGAPGMP